MMTEDKKGDWLCRNPSSAWDLVTYWSKCDHQRFQDHGMVINIGWGTANKRDIDK